MYNSNNRYSPAYKHSGIQCLECILLVCLHYYNANQDVKDNEFFPMIISQTKMLKILLFCFGATPSLHRYGEQILLEKYIMLKILQDPPNKLLKIDWDYLNSGNFANICKPNSSYAVLLTSC